MSWALFLLILVVFLVWCKRAILNLAALTTHPPLERATAPLPAPPKVSIVVPARDEEAHLAACLTSLLNQTYPHYEIIVVDDRSSDGTREIVERFKQQSDRVSSVQVETLPPGWTGKNHALWQGSQRASGDWILHTDADTVHQPEGLASAMTYALQKNVDCLTLVPRCSCVQFSEHLIQPFAFGCLATWLPMHQANDPKSSVTMANGQFFLVKRAAYQAVGGNEAIKGEVVEDVALAKRLKAQHFQIELGFGMKLYSTRMYESFHTAWNGWKRIFLFLFERHLPTLAKKLATTVCTSFLPFLVAALAILQPSTGQLAAMTGGLALATCLLIFALRLRFNAFLGTHWWSALLHPASAFVISCLLVDCLYTAWRGGSVSWKGHSYK